MKNTTACPILANVLNLNIKNVKVQYAVTLCWHDHLLPSVLIAYSAHCTTVVK